MRNYTVCRLKQIRPNPDLWAVHHPNGTRVAQAETRLGAIRVARALWWEDHTHRHARPLWHPTLHMVQLPLGEASTNAHH